MYNLLGFFSIVPLVQVDAYFLTDLSPAPCGADRAANLSRRRTAAAEVTDDCSRALPTTETECCR